MTDQVTVTVTSTGGAHQWMPRAQIDTVFGQVLAWAVAPDEIQLRTENALVFEGKECHLTGKAVRWSGDSSWSTMRIVVSRNRDSNRKIKKSGDVARLILADVLAWLGSDPRYKQLARICQLRSTITLSTERSIQLQEQLLVEQKRKAQLQEEYAQAIESGFDGLSSAEIQAIADQGWSR